MKLGEVISRVCANQAINDAIIVEENLNYLMHMLYVAVKEEARRALSTMRKGKASLTREIGIANKIIANVKQDLLPIIIENTTSGVRVTNNDRAGYLDDIVSWTSKRYYDSNVVGAKEIATAMAIMDVCPIENNRELSQLLREKQDIWGR